MNIKSGTTFWDVTESHIHTTLKTLKLSGNNFVLSGYGP